MAVERFPVEASHILMFARALGDEDPAYCDAERAKQTEADGIIAPPTFTMAGTQFDPHARLRPKPGVPWFGSGKHPSGVMRKPAAVSAAPSEKPSAAASEKPSKPSSPALHAEQHFEYHRHLRPGDVLTAKVAPGRAWEKDSKRAGRLRFTETVTQYLDQNGQLVITARHVGVTPERAVDSADKG